MCGILGTINLPFGESTLDRIRHRGPDGEGRVEVRHGPHRIALGHRRLAIVDPSPAGDQPMQTPDGINTLVFNGEVYNHQSLRRDMAGISFRGHSDTETVLHALSRDATGALARFNGIFALGFLDAARARLLLARDPFGVKPLYYWHRGNAFAFCSELKPLLELVGGTLDTASLAELLRLRYLPAPDTLFSEIKKVRPGHCLELRLSGEELGVAESSYAPLPSEPVRLDYRDALAEYGRLFERAVERQLMSDVEMGVLLSGGVDSALVARAAQRRTGYRMKAFTVGYTDRDDSDEVADAAATAGHLGMDHRVVRIGFGDFLDVMRHGVGVVEEPLATTSLLPMLHLARLTAQDVKVVLSGQGADEPLGGYGRYQGELYRRLVPSWAARLALPLARAAGVKRERVLRGLETLAERAEPERFLAAYSVFHPDRIRRLVGCDERRSLARLRYWHDRLDPAGRPHAVARMMSVDLRMNLADDLLLYTDKITMHHGLECRVPMLDLDLVRFVEMLPARYRVRLGRTKIIHKDYAGSTLPAAIVHRRKKGFQSPTRKWFREGRMLRDLLLDPRSRFASSFDLAEVGRVIAEHERGFNRERHLFLLLSIHYWFEEVLPAAARPVKCAA